MVWCYNTIYVIYYSVIYYGIVVYSITLFCLKHQAIISIAIIRRKCNISYCRKICRVKWIPVALYVNDNQNLRPCLLGLSRLFAWIIDILFNSCYKLLQKMEMCLNLFISFMQRPGVWFPLKNIHYGLRHSQKYSSCLKEY